MASARRSPLVWEFDRSAATVSDSGSILNRADRSWSAGRNRNQMWALAAKTRPSEEEEAEGREAGRGPSEGSSGGAPPPQKRESRAVKSSSNTTGGLFQTGASHGFLTADPMVGVRPKVET